MTDEEKPKRQRRKRAPGTTTRLSEQQLATMGDLFPGFSDWYRRTHDADGHLLPSARIAGLKPQEEDKQK